MPDLIHHASQAVYERSDPAAVSLEDGLKRIFLMTFLCVLGVLCG
jgi:hypothetical protein